MTITLAIITVIAILAVSHTIVRYSRAMKDLQAGNNDLQQRLNALLEAFPNAGTDTPDIIEQALITHNCQYERSKADDNESTIFQASYQSANFIIEGSDYMWRISMPVVDSYTPDKTDDIARAIQAAARAQAPWGAKYQLHTISIDHEPQLAISFVLDVIIHPALPHPDDLIATLLANLFEARLRYYQIQKMDEEADNFFTEYANGNVAPKDFIRNEQLN